MWWLKSTCNSRSGVSSALFWLLRAPAHSWCIHMQALTHNDTQNIKFKVMKEYIKYNVIRLHKETTGHSGTSSSLWFTAESVNCVLLWFPLSSVLPAPDESWADAFISWFPFEISTRVGHSHTAFWDSIFLTLLWTPKKCLPQMLTCFLSSKSDVLLGPLLFFFYGLCVETLVSSQISPVVMGLAVYLRA